MQKFYAVKIVADGIDTFEMEDGKRRFFETREAAEVSANEQRALVAPHVEIVVQEIAIDEAQRGRW